MVGGVVWRAVQSGPGRCTKEQAFLLLELLVHPKCTLPLLSPLVIIQHCGALCTPPFQSATFSGSIMSGGSLCDLPLLQLSVTSRMVAEKWPHKKAIKEHKGSESRAQCDISRKWDICVHGARPTSDMFTRVQGGAGATQTGCGTSLLGRDCSPLITPRRETRLHEKGCRGGGGGEKPTTGAAAHVAAKGDVGAETSFPPTFCLNEGFHPGSPPLGCQHRELVANIAPSKVFQPHLGFQGVTSISN